MTATQIFVVFLKLGMTSFGGPQAHIGYFHTYFVVKHALINERDFSQLLALCQLIPGPASSQLGMAIGMRFANYKGALAAWIGFTLPSFIIMAALGAGAVHSNIVPEPIIHALLLVSVVVVTHAVYSMSLSFCSTWATKLIALVTAAFILFVPINYSNVIAIALVGLIYWFHGSIILSEDKPSLYGFRLRYLRVDKALIAYFVLLATLPLFALTDSHLISLFDMTYRSGALVFGGGHVVLPFLQQEFVTNGMVDEQLFLSGYGLAQALPGPLFTFATFAGAASTPNSIVGAIVATIGIFLPGFLLLIVGLSMLSKLQKNLLFQHCLVGINACVVGLLLASLVNPIIVKAVNHYSDVLIVLIGLIVLILAKRRLIECIFVVVTLSLINCSLFPLS